MAPPVLREPDAAARSRLVRLPNGDYVPSLNGVIDAPEWSFDYGSSDGQGETMGAVTGRCEGILLGRKTYEMFEPTWSTRTVEDDPGAPFFNDTMKYVVSSTFTEDDATWRNSRVLGPYDADAIRKGSSTDIERDSRVEAGSAERDAYGIHGRTSAHRAHR